MGFFESRSTFLICPTNQISFASKMLYTTSICLSRVSILLLYHRIFSISSSPRIWINIIAVLLAGYYISSIFGLTFASIPVEAQWKLWMPSSTINNKAFWLANAVINIFFDIALLSIPQTRVWKLPLSRKNKILVSMTFGLGAL